MQSPPVQREPTVAAATPAGWRNWLFNLFHFGRRRLAELGLTLSLGFASALLALYLFAGLADEVAERETHQLDDGVLLWLAQWQSPGLDLVARFISALGSELLAVLLVGLLVAFTLQRRWGAAIALLLTVGGAQLLNNVLKDLFQRTRPAPVEGFIPAQAFSFPSGHAMVSTAFYLFVAYLAWRLLRGRTRLVSLAVLLLLVLLIGLSRLYLGVHFLTDVLAGYAAGFAWTQSVIFGGRLLARRSAGRRVPGPAATAGQTASRGGPVESSLRSAPPAGPRPPGVRRAGESR